MDEEYNGWPNYETWLVNSYLLNNEEFRKGLATELLFDFGIVSDLLQSALNRIRWDEIIRANSEQ